MVFIIRYYSATTRKDPLAHGTRIHLEGIMINEIRQSQKGKYGTLTLSCARNNFPGMKRMAVNPNRKKEESLVHMESGTGKRILHMYGGSRCTL